jgi:hypothetical protein
MPDLLSRIFEIDLRMLVDSYESELLRLDMDSKFSLHLAILSS